MHSRADPVRIIDDQKERRLGRGRGKKRPARRRPDIIWTY
jgi:hypothetical protein